MASCPEMVFCLLAQRTALWVDLQQTTEITCYQSSDPRCLSDCQSAKWRNSPVLRGNFAMLRHISGSVYKFRQEPLISSASDFQLQPLSTICTQIAGCHHTVACVFRNILSEIGNFSLRQQTHVGPMCCSPLSKWKYIWEKLRAGTCQSISILLSILARWC